MKDRACEYCGEEQAIGIDDELKAYCGRCVVFARFSEAKKTAAYWSDDYAATIAEYDRRALV